jgi:hypothetical protein
MVYDIQEGNREPINMKLAACVLVLSAGLCSWVLAEEPQTPAAQPAAAQTPAPSAPSSASEAKPAAATAATTPAKTGKSEVFDAAATDALIKKMRARGYKPVNRKGILVFCRPEGEIGTHFQRERCNTLDELKDAERTGQEFTNQIQQQGSPTPFRGDSPPNMHP